MSYKNIIEEILNVYDINASEFADKIGVQRSGISHILSGRNNPSIDFLIKVKEQFPDLQWDFLVKGKKPMLVTDVNKGEIDNIQRSIFENEEEDVSKASKNKKPRQLKKIVWFYDDSTFETFRPKD